MLAHVRNLNVNLHLQARRNISFLPRQKRCSALTWEPAARQCVASPIPLICLALQPSCNHVRDFLQTQRI